MASRAAEDEHEVGTAESRYKFYERERQPFLDAARKSAALTIPYVCPPSTYKTRNAYLPKPNQGLGFRGVNNLTGKFLTVLMPPGMPFFKYGLTPVVESNLSQQEGALGNVQLALSKYEMDIVDTFASDGDRAGISAGFLHLPIAGNVLLNLLPKGGVRHFGLAQYVVRRATDGTPLEIIVCESTPIATMDPDHLAQLDMKLEKKPTNETIDVFTRIYKEVDGRYYEYQEARGVTLEGTEGDYPADALPWLPLRWSYVAGEDYGRGLIEGVFKDMKRYDEHCKALGDAAKNAAKLIWMVQGGGGQALVDRLSSAESGEFVYGDREAVKALQQEKANDLQVTAKEKEELKKELSMLFLLGTSIQRGGDRVTKFEVEFLARELEAVYSNEYTIIGREFQEPYLKAKSAQLRRRGVITTLPKEAVKVTITTGIDALGRGSDQQRLESLGEVAKNVSQVDESLMNRREFMRRSAANLSVKPEGLIPSDEEVAQREQQQHAQATMQSVAPEIAKGISASALQAQASQLEGQAAQPPEGVAGP